MYNELRTLAFQFAPDITKLEHTFYTLAFLPRWKSILRDLQIEITGDPKKSRFKINILNKAFRALIPDLISIVPNAYLDKTETWFYSAQPIDVTALHIIIQQWLNIAFPKACEASIKRVRQQLQKDDLQWQQKTLNLAHWVQEANGTAKLDSDLFVILPDFFAAKFSDAQVSIRLGSEILQFRRCPLAPGGKGAELVSWPPLCYSYQGKKVKQDWRWSVVITFTVQTIPFQSFPVIHCDLSVRRWVSLPNTFLPKGETSVALLTKVPWIEGLPQTNSFQVAPVKWQLIPKKEQKDEQKFRVVWGSDLVSLLDKLQLKQPFPAPQAIRMSPEEALNLNGSPNVAIFYRNGMVPDHKVGTGLWPGDRRSLAEQIAKLLAPTLVFTKAPQREKYTSPKLSNPFFEKKEPDKHSQDVRYAERRHLIGEAVDGQLTLEIRYQDSKVRDELLKVIGEYLGTTPETLDNKTWKTEELTLTVKSELLGAMGDNLEVDSTIKSTKDRLHRAIHKRIDKIKYLIPPSSNQNAIATLIELSGAEAYKNAEEDPKQALRLGFAHRNRLTQFITPESTKKTKDENKASLPHRAKASFLDILRQLGVMGKPNLPLKGLPDPLNYVGIWLIKQYAKSSATRIQQKLPVLVYMASNTHEIKAIAPDLGDKWLPYQEALLKIAQKQSTGFNYKGNIMSFIKEKLNDVTALGDTLLLCNAQNLRFTWTWLQNIKITTDKLAFETETPQPITNWKGLRVVRIRSSQSHETPEWYAQREEEFGFAQGLFKITERVFASTYNKPKQFKKLSPLLSKTADSTGSKGKTYTPAPHTYAWNPGLFEMTVACIQPGDEIWQWASVAHELRNIAIHHDEPTALPLPLHLAKQIGEYTLSLEEQEESTENVPLDLAKKQLKLFSG